MLFFRDRVYIGDMWITDSNTHSSIPHQRLLQLPKLATIDAGVSVEVTVLPMEVVCLCEQFQRTDKLGREQFSFSDYEDIRNGLSRKISEELNASSSILQMVF